MNSEKWQKILGEINSDPDLKNKDVIEEIRIRLAEVLSQGEYKTWEKKKFNINHLFQVECDKSIDESTLLHISAYFGLKYVVNVLLVKGAEVNVEDNNGNTPLHYTTIMDHIDIVNTLLAKGAKVNAKGYNGHTPLHYAAGMGYINTINVLLAKGAKVNVKSNNGSTSLHCAAAKNHRYTVKYLLKQKANPCL